MVARGQPGNEEARRAGRRVCLRPLQSLVDIAAVTQEHISPCIDKERNALPLGSTTNRCDAFRLSINIVEPFAPDHAVLEIDSDYPKIEKPGDVRAERAIIVAISALEVDGHRYLNCRRDPLNNLLGKRKRKVLAVLIPLRRSDRPTAGRDRLCTGIDDRSRTACVPRVIKYDWRPFGMKGGKLFCFLGLTHGHPPFADCTMATSQTAWRQRFLARRRQRAIQAQTA